MRRPILLDNPPPSPLPSVRWSRFLESRYLLLGGLAAGGVAAVVGASLALAMLMPYVVAPDGPARAAAADVSVAVAKPSPVGAGSAAAGNGVQYVGDGKQDVKQLDRPCEEQTWPYIAAHCLKPASDQKPAAAKVAVDRSELKTSRAGMPSLAATPTPAVAEPAVAAAAVPEVAPVPAARPGPRQAAIRDDAQQKRPRSAMARAGEPKDIRPDIRPDARAEARRAYASDRNPSPAVRRWTEAEYNVPDQFGGARRVVVIRPQSIHQAAAFSAER